MQVEQLGGGTEYVLEGREDFQLVFKITGDQRVGTGHPSDGDRQRNSLRNRGYNFRTHPAGMVIFMSYQHTGCFLGRGQHHRFVPGRYAAQVNHLRFDSRLAERLCGLFTE